ncbi:MAG: phytanoyl-CoA dioxygenase family protein [Gemmatimonadota bacterium]|nr:phytanoyl-CoA dioxygenase family protein [Gemmatimonadota bacterium]
MTTDQTTISKPTPASEAKPVSVPTPDPVPMTEEQKFFFDLKGWILVPSVLTETEIEEMKAEVYAAVEPENKGKNSGFKRGFHGKLADLLDHPAVVGILNEILTEPPFVGDDHYGFRCENSFLMVREPGWESTVKGTGLPHVVRPPQQANAMRYQVQGGKIFAGLTRVVWELEEVRSGYGGTSFLSGSHKAHFNYGGPDRYRPNISESPWEESLYAAMEDYSCPPGSMLVFTESLIHAANDWTNPDNRRCAVFNCYNSIWAQWHRLNLDHEIIDKMPPKRQSLFRGTWQLGGDGNRAYSLDNRSV